MTRSSCGKTDNWLITAPVHKKGANYSGLDLQGGDQETLAELIATYSDSEGEAIEGKRSQSKSKLTTATV